jgi:predicted transcriptional regulator
VETMTIKINCEESVWYILPIIRKEFAKNLIKDHGLTQRKAAEKLGITESAVSQYVSKKRGDLKISDPTVQREIKVSTKRIAEGDVEVMKIEICRVCRLLQGKQILEKKQQ